MADGLRMCRDCVAMANAGVCIAGSEGYDVLERSARPSLGAIWVTHCSTSTLFLWFDVCTRCNAAGHGASERSCVRGRISCWEVGAGRRRLVRISEPCSALACCVATLSFLDDT